jgi:hypothetical protein
VAEIGPLIAGNGLSSAFMTVWGGGRNINNNRDAGSKTSDGGLTPGGVRLHYAGTRRMADRSDGGPVNRPRAADDFETIRARLDELRRERAASDPDAEARSGKTNLGSRESEAELRRRARMEGLPPPWVPTIFVKNPRL